MAHTLAAPLSVPFMRTLLHERYAGPEHLRIVDVPLPSPHAGQVRVRVRAASINAMDYRIMRADPFLVRLQCGLFRPRTGQLGADFSGVVDAVGPGVTDFAMGDLVHGSAFFSDGLGAFAEAVVTSARAIVKVPRQLGAVDAAALPLAGVTALQAVRDCAHLARGQSVLVHGAGGGVGSLLVQIAKAYGAHVTAVCGRHSVALVQSLGADSVLDYGLQSVAPDARFDAVFGVNGFCSLATYRRQLNPGGTYVMIGGSRRQLFDALLFGRLSFFGSGRHVRVLTIDDSLRQRDLLELGALWSSGQLRVVIDRVFPFTEAIEALHYVEKGHVRGKVVLRFD